MANLNFEFPETSSIDGRIWNSTYITGLEGIPWRCFHQLTGDQFSIRRNIEESGKLNITWPTKSAGNLCLTTTSLRLSDSPYNLVVELARGTVFRLKNQTEEWQRAGLKLSDNFLQLANRALNTFLSSLAAKSPEEKNSLAQQSIDASIEAIIQLCETYSLQALEVRKQNEGTLATLSGAHLAADFDPSTATAALDRAFNLISVPADLAIVEGNSGRREFGAIDNQIEWSIQRGKRVCVGPLANFRSGGLPKWMVLLERDFDNIRRIACQHVQSIVQRYRGRVHIWNCAAGLNLPSEMDWNDEDVLRMAVSLIETVRNADERTPVLLTIDQPWSEFLRNQENGISPIHFADALIRADLGLSGIALDLNFCQFPQGSLPRDPVEISRLIDRWAMLGLPLLVSLTTATDVQATTSYEDHVNTWQTHVRATGIVRPETLLPLIFAKPSVHAVIWNQLTQTANQTHPVTGLWDNSGKAKPVLQQLVRLRTNFLY
ncbi:MAG: hypothetical protein KDB03_12535 [Planctomycetales bacterium]|nr:hypothetical protein [Planctomycetales bacterium]